MQNHDRLWRRLDRNGLCAAPSLSDVLEPVSCRVQIRLFHKLFGAFVVASLASVVLFAVIAHWYTGRSFLQYINDAREQRLTGFASALSEWYASEGSWDGIRGDRRAWHDLSFSIARQQREVGSEAGDELQPRRRGKPRPNSPHPRHSRPTVYDVDKTIVVGRLPYSEVITAKPIVREEQIVGWVGLPPLRRPASPRDVIFAQQQTHMLAIAAGIVFILSIIIAIVTARRLARPIRQISDGARALASGEYEMRLPALTQDEIGSLAADFNLLARALQENESARQRWIADISHELRTPLSILQAEIEAARDGIRNVDDRLIKSLGDETARLSRLVEDLYQLARADIGTLEYVFEQCRLDTIVAEALGHFADRFTDAGLHYEHNLDAGITVKGDHRRLLQLFENILENCCRYVSSPGKVTIQLERRGEYVEVRIDDSGPGVDVSFLEVLFEPLHRGEHSRNRQFGGSGLGLAICKRIVEAHEGTITAAASPSGGLQILIEIPTSQ